ncbi:MAG: hypothetical protein IPK26_28340 [Planctomycetes bacterium]|nr:hypothetical protein [Planctomycetota bacterium]
MTDNRISSRDARYRRRTRDSLFAVSGAVVVGLVVCAFYQGLAAPPGFCDYDGSVAAVFEEGPAPAVEATLRVAIARDEAPPPGGPEEPAPAAESSTAGDTFPRRESAVLWLLLCRSPTSLSAEDLVRSEALNPRDLEVAPGFVTSVAAFLQIRRPELMAAEHTMRMTAHKEMVALFAQGKLQELRVPEFAELGEADARRIDRHAIEQHQRELENAQRLGREPRSLDDFRRNLIQNNFAEGEGGRTLRLGDKSYSARPEDLVLTGRAEESFGRLGETFVLELIDFFAKNGYLTGAEIAVAVEAYRAARATRR